MEQFYYLQLMRKTTIQFLDILNGIRVAKYDTNGNILKYVTVPIKLAPKQKYYYWLKERTHEKMLPMMAASLNGITYNSVRKNNRSKKININGTEYHYNSTPYDLTFEVIVSSLYINESYQIIEQIIPFFDPYIMIQVTIPEINNTFDMKILLDSVTPDIPTDISEDDYRVINWSLNFTVQGEFLRPKKDSSIIKEIFLQYRNMDLINDSTPLSGVEGTYGTSYISGGYNEDMETLYRYEFFDGYGVYRENDPIFSEWNKSTGIQINGSQVTDLESIISLGVENGTSDLYNITDALSAAIGNIQIDDSITDALSAAIDETNLNVTNNYNELISITDELSSAIDNIPDTDLTDLYNITDALSAAIGDISTALDLILGI